MNKPVKQIPEWKMEGKKLKRKFKFKNFKEALSFINKVGKIAEKEGHHPDVRFGWGYVEIELFTHSINDLSEKDFKLAKEIDKLYSVISAN